MFQILSKVLCEPLCYSCMRTSFAYILCQRFSLTATKSHFPLPNTMKNPMGAYTIGSNKLHVEQSMLGQQTILSCSFIKRHTCCNVLQNALPYSKYRNKVMTHEILLQRLYNSHAIFTVKNPLFDSYLQSLCKEYEQLKSGKSQFHSEREETQHVLKLQYLQASCDSAQRLYDIKKQIEEINQLIQAEEDAEMRTLLEKEIVSFENEMTKAENELIDVLVGEDPADNSGVILEVSAGVGGQEAMLFCAEVFNMYCNYSMAKGWNVSIVNRDEVELGGYRKASIDISGLDVYKCLKHEAGVHRVQRVPKTEKAGRIHTSTISVSVLPQPREVDVVIDKKDLKVETFRGSGPGGQSVNTTDSAVRITHLPTGIVSECKQERSQIKNKDIAMKRLKMRIYQEQLDKEEAERRATRKVQMGTRGRSEKIRTYNFQQDRITDHRAKESQSNLADFMSGGDSLNDMILKVAQDYRYQILESMLDDFENNSKKQRH